MDLRIGLFVRFTDRDDQGKYFHDGEIVSLESDEISFAIPGAVLTVPMIEQDKFEEVERPKGWTTKVTKAVSKPEPSKKDGTSTRERVAEIVRQNADKSRAELIALCGEAGIGPGSASTYIALARKS